MRANEDCHHKDHFTECLVRELFHRKLLVIYQKEGIFSLLLRLLLLRFFDRRDINGLTGKILVKFDDSISSTIWKEEYPLKIEIFRQ